MALGASDDTACAGRVGEPTAAKVSTSEDANSSERPTSFKKKQVWRQAAWLRWHCRCWRRLLKRHKPTFYAYDECHWECVSQSGTRRARRKTYELPSCNSYSAAVHQLFEKKNYQGTVIEPNIGLIVTAMAVMVAHEVWRAFEMAQSAIFGRPATYSENNDQQLQPVKREQFLSPNATSSGTFDISPPACKTFCSNGQQRAAKNGAVSHVNYEQSVLSCDQVLRPWTIFETIGAKSSETTFILSRLKPQVLDVQQFLVTLYSVTQFSAECFIIALIYVARVLNNPYNLTLTGASWRPLLFTALLVAHKYWDDEYLSNKDFKKGYPGLNVRDANTLEANLLKLIRYNISVQPSTYTHSYFVCRIVTEPFYNEAIGRVLFNEKPVVKHAYLWPSASLIDAANKQRNARQRAISEGALPFLHQSVNATGYDYDCHGHHREKSYLQDIQWNWIVQVRLQMFVAQCTKYMCQNCRPKYLKRRSTGFFFPSAKVFFPHRPNVNVNGYKRRPLRLFFWPARIRVAKKSTSRTRQASLVQQKESSPGSPLHTETRNTSLFILAVFPQCFACGAQLLSPTSTKNSLLSERRNVALVVPPLVTVASSESIRHACTSITPISQTSFFSKKFFSSGQCGSTNNFTNTHNSGSVKLEHH